MQLPCPLQAEDGGKGRPGGGLRPEGDAAAALRANLRAPPGRGAGDVRALAPQRHGPCGSKEGHSAPGGI